MQDIQDSDRISHDNINIYPIIPVIIHPPKTTSKFAPVKFKPYKTLALIDTGATNSAIHKRLLKILPLQKEGRPFRFDMISSAPLRDTKVKILQALHKFLDIIHSLIWESQTYLYNIQLEICGTDDNKKNNISALGLNWKYDQDIEVIIGWDILQDMGFHFHGSQGNFCCCYNQNHIDSESNKINLTLGN